MKRLGAWTFALLAVLALAVGIHIWWTSNTAHTVIDYGTSELYAREDIEAAAQTVFNRFHSLRGFELHSLACASDDRASAEILARINDNVGTHYDEAMVLVGSFRTAKRPFEGFAANDEIRGWQWHLARRHGSAWEIVNQGCP